MEEGRRPAWPWGRPAPPCVIWLSPLASVDTTFIYFQIHVRWCFLQLNGWMMGSACVNNEVWMVVKGGG